MLKQNNKGSTLSGFIIGIVCILVIGVFAYIFLTSTFWKRFQKNLSQGSQIQQTTSESSSSVQPTPPIVSEEQTPIRPKQETTPIISEADKLVSGLFNPAQRSDFQTVPKQYTNKPTFMHRDVANHLIKMIEAAHQDNIKLEIVSGFRSFDHQRSIWERKWNSYSGTPQEKANKILRYSSFPGLSRHHWGTDFDFNSVDPDYWRSPEGKRIHEWLQQNAPKFGFCEPYSGHRSGGYENEAWHWSYKPLAKQLQQQRLATWNNVFKHGVLGSEVVNAQSERMKEFVTVIDQSCM